MRRILKKFVDSRRALPLAFAVMLLLTCPLAFNVILNTNRFLQTELLVAHSNRVLLELESLSMSVQEARSLQLQYLANPGPETRKQDLQAFRTTVDQIAAWTDHIAFLTHDNLGQR